MEALKKTLPHAVSKTKLVEMFSDQYSESKIKQAINLIIIDNRKNKPLYKDYTPAKLRRIKAINHQEFMEFIAIYGEPKGYEV